jgi:uncharacterized membrane protein
VVRFRQRLDTPGFHQYTGAVESPLNTHAQHNDGGTVVYAVGTPQALYVTATTAAGGIPALLSLADFTVHLASPATLPAAASALSAYDLVIFDNVPAAAITTTHMQAIADYVGQLGGGFLMTGGTRSFGPGGYAQTPLERILPVDMRVRRPYHRPHLGLVLLLDTSGSMALPHGGKTKITLAAEAILSLHDLFDPADALGIVAFDTHPSPLMPLQALPDKAVLQARLSTLQASGGTALYPALALASQWLRQAHTEKKQVVLVSDGRTAPADFAPLLTQLVTADIRLSVIGVGADVEREFLTELATRGNGRAYFTDDPRALATVLQRETLLAGGQWVQERHVRPQVVAAHEIFGGIDASTIPALAGYVATTAKPPATVLLESDTHDPLLACWRYGLGKALAFTSDLSTSWTAALRTWDGFGPLWTRMVRWTSRSTPPSRLHPHLRIEGDAARLTVEAREENGRFRNGLEVRATVSTPEARTLEVRLTQTAPGKYEGPVPVAQPGTYLLRVTAEDADGSPAETLHVGFHAARLREHQTASADLSLLRAIARAASGMVLTADESPFRRGIAGTRTMDVWQFPALAALLLLVLEIAWRQGSRWRSRSDHPCNPVVPTGH